MKVKFIAIQYFL